MAGTFTHWMVVEEAFDKYQNLPQKHHYFPIILDLNHFVSLGAVGPDYPYLTDLLQGFLKVHSWADRMHYENTGDFIRKGIESLPDAGTDDFNICLAWLCGFATHLVTDSVIHPVVQAIVGPYIFNSSEHRHCELIQDSYIFHEIMGIELEYSNYENLFKMCSDKDDGSKLNPVLRNFWRVTLQMTHPTAAKWFHRIDPDTWHKNFLSRIHSASDPLPLFRHLEQEKDLAYKKTTEILPDERRRFIEQVNLPGSRKGEFKKDAFDKAVKTVIEAWEHLFVDIEAKGSGQSEEPVSYIKNWDLDTGVDQDEQYYWSQIGE